MYLERTKLLSELTVTQILIITITIFILVISAISAVLFIERKYKSSLQQQLTTVLKSNQEAIQIWGRGQHQIIEKLVNEPALKVPIIELLQLSKDKQTLISSDAQQKLRQVIHPYIESGRYQGFFLIAPDNISLASSRDENIGTPNLLNNRPNILEQLWKGESIITPIQSSDVPLSTHNEKHRHNHETMFVGTSIKDNKGKIIALLTLRINLHDELIPLMIQGRLGQSGESYVFNHQGIMLSSSRFEDQLRGIGLLDAGESSASILRLTDPGINLTLTNKAQPASEQRPLTRMALSATRGEDGYDLEGYRDYRGVPVIGAWVWNREFDLGITIEQDVDEAYELFYFISYFVYGGALVALLIIIALVRIFSIGKYRLQQLQKRLQGIIETAIDGILVIDKFGIIESVNPAVETLFGYQPHELIGKNITVLMPAPYKDEHDGYLQHYLNTGEKRIIGTGREVEARRKDGTIFPIELSVNRMDLENEIHFAGIIHDISNQKRASKELMEAKERLEAAASAGIIGIWEWDVVNDHLVWDKMMYQLYGINEEDFSGAYDAWSKSIHPEDKEMAENEVAAALRGEREYAPEFRIIWPDGSIHHLKAMSHTTFNEQGEPLEMIGINYDLTEQKRTEFALAKANTEAETANRAKSTFLATMSHEIRTPLNGVVATVDMLSHTQLESSQMSLVETARDSSILLQSIIDDILDFSKIEAGKLEFEALPISLESLVEKLGETLHYLATKSDVELLLYCDPNLPQVIGDPVRLRQILYNLMGNAIKFSSSLSDRRGRIMISAVMKEQTNNRVAFTFVVSDNGIGMDEEVQQRLFQPFVQGEYETNRHFGGTGLGLVITKRLVELMGGAIEVESNKGEGSTFTVSLSLEQAVPSTNQKNTGLAGIKALLVNSDKETTWILNNYLQHAGVDINVITAEQLLDKYREISQDGDHVIIFDSRNEEETKRSIFQQLNLKIDDEYKENLRIIVIERGQRRNVRENEFSGVTLDLNAMQRLTLLNAVANICGRKPANYEVINQHNTLQNKVVLPDKTVTLRQLILVVDDNGTNRKVIGQQLNMLGYDVDFAEDGREGLTKWHNNAYAMVMTDCHMPIMDGYQLSEAIRSAENEGEHLPIIAITADALKGTDNRCFSSGMDDYLTKPIQLFHIQGVLKKWLSFSPETVTNEVAPKVANDDVHEVIDPNALGNLIGTQDPMVLDDYYTDFLEGSRETARYLQVAYQDDELSKIKSQAHKLKSSAQTVGANSLADCCLALEMAAKANDSQTVEQQMYHFNSLYQEVEQWITNHHQSISDEN